MARRCCYLRRACDARQGWRHLPVQRAVQYHRFERTAAAGPSRCASLTALCDRVQPKPLTLRSLRQHHHGALPLWNAGDRGYAVLCALQRRRLQLGGRWRVPPMPDGRQVHCWQPSGGVARLVVRASAGGMPSAHSSVDGAAAGAHQTPLPSCSRARCTRPASLDPTPETMLAL